MTWQPVELAGLPDGARISRSRSRRARTDVGCTRSRASVVAEALAAIARSIDPTTAARRWTFGTRQLASAGGKMYADPQNPDVVYLMGTAIYRSTDGGQHVAAFWGAPSGADPRFLWIDPTNPKRMIAGVDQGAAISVDGGETWTPYYGARQRSVLSRLDRLRLSVSRVRTAAGLRHRVRAEPHRLRRSSGRTTGIRPADSRTDS